MDPVFVASRTSKDSRMLWRRGWGMLLWWWLNVALSNFDGAVEVGLGAVAKGGCLRVEVVEEVAVLCVVGRRLDWFGNGKEGEPVAGAGDGAASKGDGARFAAREGEAAPSSRSSGATLVCRLGEAEGGVSSLLCVCRDGDAGTLKPLPGLARGLDARSEV